MADKDKIQNMLEMLFTDMEILCSYDKTLVKSALHDFMAVTARAIVEAGADSEVVMNGVKHYRQDMKHVDLAMMDLEEAIKLDASQTEAYLIRGQIYLSQRKRS